MPKIFLVSKTVEGDLGDELSVLHPVLGSKHLFLVFQDDDNSERAIRGGPEHDNPLAFGKLTVQANVDISSTRDNPLDSLGLAKAISRTEIPLGDQNPYEVWDQMTAHAYILKNSTVPYAAFFDPQNSNSVIASTMASVGLNIVDYLPPGTSFSDVPGVANTLDVALAHFNMPNPYSGTSDSFTQNLMPIGWNNPTSLEPSPLPTLPPLNRPQMNSLFGLNFRDED